MDARYHPVVVAPNVKHVASIGYVIGAVKIAYHLGMAASIAFAYEGVPGVEGFAGVGVFFPKLAQRFLGND